MKVLILEDEHKAGKELSLLLESSRFDIAVLDVLDSVTAGIKWFEENSQPDLIFSDIQLADGLCFEIFRTGLVTAPIVFCTAYDEYILKSFDTNAVHYLLKPVNADDIERSLVKYQALKKSFKELFAVDLSNTLLASLTRKYKETLLVYAGSKVIPVKISEVAFFYLVNSYVAAYLSSGVKYTLSESLDELEEKLDPVAFFRANRQFIIHRKHITGIEKSFARKLIVNLDAKVPEELIVSKAKAGEFMSWIEGA